MINSIMAILGKLAKCPQQSQTLIFKALPSNRKQRKNNKKKHGIWKFQMFFYIYHRFGPLFSYAVLETLELENKEC